MAVCSIKGFRIETVAWFAINEAEAHFASVHHMLFQKCFILIILALGE
jgi:hypothetical protein